MADVGRLAGVSHQTVSRVINHKGYVTDATRRAVEEAMAQLHFRPNRVARGLALSRTESIGVINLGMPENASLAQCHFGICTAASSAGYSVTMANVSDSDDIATLTAEMEKCLDQFLSHGVDGIIVSSPFSIDFPVVAQLSGEVPIVEMTSESIRGISSVSTDNEHGGRLVAEHLVSLGHTRIAHLDGPDDRADAASRRQGFDAALRENGHRVVARLGGDWTSASGFEAGVQLRDRDDFSALFCSNDQMALGVLHAYSEVGRTAPTDVSVVGFDGIADSAHFMPPLTTVQQDFVDMGRRAFVQLQQVVNGDRARRVLVPPRLVVRASTRAANPSSASA